MIKIILDNYIILDNSDLKLLDTSDTTRKYATDDQWTDFYHSYSDPGIGKASYYNTTEPEVTTQFAETSDTWSFETVSFVGSIMNIKYQGNDYKVYFSGKSENIDYGIIRKDTFTDANIYNEKLNKYGSTFYIVYNYKTAYKLWKDLTTENDDEESKLITINLSWEDGEGYYIKTDENGIITTDENGTPHFNPRLNLQSGHKYVINTPSLSPPDLH